MESGAIDTKRCKFCTTDIPKMAKVCPNCKNDLRDWGSRHPILMTMLVLFIFWSVVSWMNQAINGVPSTSSSWGNISTTNIEDASKVKEDEIKKKLAWLKIIEQGVADVYGFPHISITVRNDTGRSIDAYTFRAKLTDNYNQVLSEQISGKKYFAWVTQEVIKSWKTNYGNWQLSLFPNATKIQEIYITSIHFSDKDETVVLDE